MQHRILRVVVVLCIVFVWGSSFVLAAPPVAYRGAKILTAAGKTFDPGTLVVQDGRILAVGPQAEVVVPAGSTTVDAAGKVIIPGLVDTHSHLGVYSRPAVPAN